MFVYSYGSEMGIQTPLRVRAAIWGLKIIRPDTQITESHEEKTRDKNNKVANRKCDKLN